MASPSPAGRAIVRVALIAAAAVALGAAFDAWRAARVQRRSRTERSRALGAVAALYLDVHAHAVASAADDLARREPAAAADLALLGRVVRDRAHRFGALSPVFVAGADGTVLAAYDPAAPIGAERAQTGRTDPSAARVRAAMRVPEVSRSAIVSRPTEEASGRAAATNRRVVEIVAPVRGHEGELRAYVGADLDLGPLCAKIAHWGDLVDEADRSACGSRPARGRGEPAGTTGFRAIAMPPNGGATSMPLGTAAALLAVVLLALVLGGRLGRRITEEASEVERVTALLAGGEPGARPAGSKLRTAQFRSIAESLRRLGEALDRAPTVLDQLRRYRPAELEPPPDEPADPTR